jgi:hypothetical protein
MYLIGFPLLIVPFVIYNIFEFLIPSAAPGGFWPRQLVHFQLASGTDFALTAGECLTALAVLILFVELLKSTRMSTRSIVDHVLSTVLFIVILVEFILVRQAATGTFFLLLVVSFVDVIGGFSITIRTVQRDITIDGSGTPFTRG